MTAPIAKDGSLVCAAFKDFAQSLGCFAGRVDPHRCDGQIDPHHWPSKGASGVTRDDRVVPLCRAHHDAAHLGHIPRERLDEWVAEVRSRFMEQASDHAWKAYLSARMRWVQGRVFVEEIAW